MKSGEGLHVILGGHDFARTCELARIADAEGASVIQFREKSLATGEIISIADALRKITNHALFIINDRADIALATGADGVHLGQDDLPIEEARNLLGQNAIIGVSTSNKEQAIEAERAGANYVGFGHMFQTRSKEKTSAPKSKDELSSIVASVSIPVIAVGGITTLNLYGILCQRLAGIAVISAVSDAENPAAVIREFVRRLEENHAVTA